jgi:hypothetical protein
MHACRSSAPPVAPPFPVCEIAFLSVSVAAEVIPARWPAVIFRALLRHCCACLLAVSDSVAAVYLDRASTCPCSATLRDCAGRCSPMDTASETVPALLAAAPISRLPCRSGYRLRL